jgi:uncharacterized membrane protein YdjX (TVP38/TMEM64 family)
VELVRVVKDVYGQETLTGVSWDLIGVFAGAAVLFVVAHALYKAFLAPKLKTN